MGKNERMKGGKIMKILIVDNQCDYTTLKKELLEQYNIDLEVMEELTSEILKSTYEYTYVRANAKSEVDNILKFVKMEDTNLILITTNLDEKFLWNSAKYFADIIKHLTTAEAMIRRINCMFNTNITKNIEPITTDYEKELDSVVYKVLDVFCEFTDYELVKIGNNYNLFDKQLGGNKFENNQTLTYVTLWALHIATSYFIDEFVEMDKDSVAFRNKTIMELCLAYSKFTSDNNIKDGVEI